MKLRCVAHYRPTHEMSQIQEITLGCSCSCSATQAEDKMLKRDAIM